MNMGLNDKVVLVTGGSSGIGRATAVAFGQEGAKVAVTYHSNPAGAEETASLIRAAGGEAMTVRYDLADDASIQAAVTAVTERWGAIHVLVNNAVAWSAGNGPVGTPTFESVPSERWRSMIRSSLEGVYLTIQAVLPWMRAAGWGRIINVSSSLAEDGRPGSGAYSAAKAGLHGLTRSLAWEVGQANILANVVMPGMTMTERARRIMPQPVVAQQTAQTPSGKLSTPGDVASLILYLGSAMNGNITGEAIRVTGGL